MDSDNYNNNYYSINLFAIFQETTWNIFIYQILPISLIFLLVICVPCPRSYCSLCHVNLYVLLLLLRHHHHHNITPYKNIKAVFMSWREDEKTSDTMVNGITEQHKIHAHNTRWIVVLAQQLYHLLLQCRCVCDVLVHFLVIAVVTWINANVQACTCYSLYAITRFSLLLF